MDSKDMWAEFDSQTCNAPYSGYVSGEPVNCTLVKHSDDKRHYNHELRVDWY